MKYFCFFMKTLRPLILKTILLSSLFTLLLLNSSTVSAQIPDSGLIGRYDFEKNFGDSSGIGNHATNSGAKFITDRCFYDSMALVFNGINQYIDLGKQDSLNAYLNNFTTAFWFKSHPGKNNWESIIKTINNAGTGTVYSIEINRKPSGFEYGVFVAQLRDKNGKTLSMAFKDSIINNLEWHHVALVVENSSTNQYKLYLDGIEKQKLSGLPAGGPSQYNSFDNNVVAGASNSRGTITNHFSGALDQILLYKRALDSIEIVNIYNTSCDSIVCTDTTFTTHIDTIVYNDTLIHTDTIQYIDTLILNDTIQVLDTTFINIYDTTYIDIIDTIFVDVFDTTFVSIFDTTIVTVFDTTEIIVRDTIWVTDTNYHTVQIYDTVLTSKCDTITLNFIDTTCNSQWIKILLYPNPVRDHLSIEFEEEYCFSDYFVTVWNVLGQKVGEFNIDSRVTKYPVGGLARSTYFMRLYNYKTGSVRVLKFIIK